MAVSQNGSLIACALDRAGVINAAAGLLRRQLKDPASAARLTFVGTDLAELLSTPVMDPNWKRKGPRIDIELYTRAEALLQTDLVSSEESALLEEYRAALVDEDYRAALERLVQLGEWQRCTNLYWKILEQIAAFAWHTTYCVDRRRKGQLEAKSAEISRRARGQW